MSQSQAHLAGIGVGNAVQCRQISPGHGRAACVLVPTDQEWMIRRRLFKDGGSPPGNRHLGFDFPVPGQERVHGGEPVPGTGQEVGSNERVQIRRLKLGGCTVPPSFDGFHQTAAHSPGQIGG